MNLLQVSSFKVILHFTNSHQVYAPMPAMKPAVKDIAVNLLNAPRTIMLGNKNYDLKFSVYNLKENERDIKMVFSSKEVSVNPADVEISLKPKEKKEISVNISPTGDGKLDLALTVKEKVEVKYTETVLEQPDGTIKPVDASPGAGSVSAPRVKPTPSTTTSPTKPPSKPAMKPSPGVKLESRINSIREKYMAIRTELQSLSQGSPQYQEKYQEAVELKSQYDSLKKQLEKGAEPISKPAVKPLKPTTKPVQKPSKPVSRISTKPPVKPRTKPPAKTGDDDLLTTLTNIMNEYNNLRTKLQGMESSDPNYMQIRERAVELSKKYNSMREEAKRKGLVKD